MRLFIHILLFVLLWLPVTVRGQLRITEHLLIIMLTAKDTQTDQQEGYEVGADSYLTKPFSISMLRSRIVNLLTARQRLAAYLASSQSDRHTAAPEASQQTYPPVSQLDRQFLADVTGFIKANVGEQNLTLAMVGESVHMSHSTLYRKIKALTGLSGNEFIRKVRLHHSLQLMLENHRNVSEAAYESGFSSLPYFRTCFKEEFGMSPTEYLKTI